MMFGERREWIICGHIEMISAGQCLGQIDANVSMDDGTANVCQGVQGTFGTFYSLQLLKLLNITSLEHIAEKSLVGLPCFVHGFQQVCQKYLL